VRLGRRCGTLLGRFRHHQSCSPPSGLRAGPDWSAGFLRSKNRCGPSSPPRSTASAALPARPVEDAPCGPGRPGNAEPPKARADHPRESAGCGPRARQCNPRHRRAARPRFERATNAPPHALAPQRSRASPFDTFCWRTCEMSAREVQHRNWKKRVPRPAFRREWSTRKPKSRLHELPQDSRSSSEANKASSDLVVLDRPDKSQHASKRAAGAKFPAAAFSAPSRGRSPGCARVILTPGRAAPSQSARSSCMMDS